MSVSSTRDYTCAEGKKPFIQALESGGTYRRKLPGRGRPCCSHHRTDRTSDEAIRPEDARAGGWTGGRRVMRKMLETVIDS